MDTFDASEAAGELRLETPDGPVRLDLDLFNVFLTDVAKEEKARFPETFELEGEFVMVVGTIPPEHSVGYGSAWQQVVGHALRVDRVGGEHGRNTPSDIDLPGYGRCNIAGGEIILRSAGPVWEARTPLEGECTLEVETPGGVQRLRGTFAVPGTTWG